MVRNEFRARPRLSLRPRVEAVESRFLLSGAGSVLLAAHALRLAQISGLNGSTGQPSPLHPTLTRSQAAVGFPQEGGINGPALSTGADPSAIASGVGVPSPHEVARNHFSGRFAGTYQIAPGRTDEHSVIVKLRSSTERQGSMTDILHAGTQAVIAVPDQGSPVPPLGIVELNPVNMGVVGQLLLRVQGTPGDAALPAPGVYTWVVDPSSSGSYTNAVGQGTLQIRYQPQTPLTSAGFGKGTFRMIVQGTLIRTGLIG